MVNAEIVNIIKSYLNELSDKGITISKAYLFGSHINNSANENSDIDLMLISPLFDVEIDKYLPAIWLSSIRTDNRIEPITIGEARFRTDDSSPIIAVVKQEGVEIAA